MDSALFLTAETGVRPGVDDLCTIVYSYVHRRTNNDADDFHRV